MYSNFQLDEDFVLKYINGVPTKIYLHKHLTHEYFHTRKFHNLWHTEFLVK